MARPLQTRETSSSLHGTDQSFGSALVSGCGLRGSRLALKKGDIRLHLSDPGVGLHSREGRQADGRAGCWPTAFVGEVLVGEPL